jgi:hypothetical protein
MVREWGGSGVGGRNKGEVEVGIDLLDQLDSAPNALSFVLMTTSEVVCNMLDWDDCVWLSSPSWRLALLGV